MKNTPYIPTPGDVVWLNFAPSSGREIQKRRPALVLSDFKFNQHVGFAFFAPITNTQRGHAFELVLAESAALDPIKNPDKAANKAADKTKGVALLHQVKSLDYRERQAEFIEKIPEALLLQALENLRCIFGGI